LGDDVLFTSSFILKFFFFDAEKIVSFAQVNTPQQRAELSQAYSQVLGIQKYAELKSTCLSKTDDEKFTFS